MSLCLSIVFNMGRDHLVDRFNIGDVGLWTLVVSDGDDADDG